MGYNIDTWKTKKLENLVVPLKAFYENSDKDSHPSRPKITNLETMEVELACGCGQVIEGVLKDGLLLITKFDMSGEGSGYFKLDVLDSVLRQSSGELEAVLVWEGGDSITKLKVVDGVLQEDLVEL